jgi:hypothetical protein
LKVRQSSAAKQTNLRGEVFPPVNFADIPPFGGN